MPKELPYFRWYPADAESDFRYSALSLPELGLFHRCLNFSWLNEGLPADPMEIGRSLRVSVRDIKALWPRVSECFELRDGRAYNRRQEEERAHARTKSERNTSAVRTRYERTSIVPTNEVQHARAPAASASVSASVVDFESKREIILSDDSKFQEFWSIWSIVRGTHGYNAAFQAWIGVAGGFEADVIECARSYLASLDNPAKGFNPGNFLFEQAKDGFRARWPAYVNGVPRKQTGVERMMALAQKRINEGRSPL